MTGSDGYAARPWVRWYAPGVSERLHVPDIALTQLLYDAANDFPRRKALTFLGRTMTYRALVDTVDHFAGALRDLGVRKGEVVHRVDEGPVGHRPAQERHRVLRGAAPGRRGRPAQPAVHAV